MTGNGKVVIVRSGTSNPDGDWMFFTKVYYVPHSPDAYAVALEAYFTMEPEAAVEREGLAAELDDELSSLASDVPVQFGLELKLYSFLHSHENRLFVDPQGRALLTVDIRPFDEVDAPDLRQRVQRLRERIRFVASEEG